MTTADLSEPYAVAVDLAKNIYYVTEGRQNHIVKFDPKTGESSLLLVGQLNSPEGIVAATRLGVRGLVVSDTRNHQIKFVTFDGVATLLAGSTQGTNDAALGLSAKFSYPAGLAADAAGNIYVADLLNNRVRKIDNTPAAAVTTLVPAERFNRPAALAVDPDDRIFVADTGNNVIKAINTNGTVDTYNVVSGTDLDGPRGLLWVGGNAGLLIADTANSAIRSAFGKSVGAIRLFAGAIDEIGLVNGTFAAARFTEPVGMALDANGNILVADLKNNALRLITRATVPTPIVTPLSGIYSNSISITVTNSNTNTVFRYTINGSEPTPLDDVLPKPFILTGGPSAFQVRGFSSDLTASVTVSNNYTFAVFPLATLTPGGSFSNDVPITVTTKTETNVTFTYTTNGKDPETNSTPWVNPTVLSNSGPVIVRGFREGFEPSAALSNTFSFFVNPLSVPLSGGSFSNDVPVTVASRTTNVTFYFRRDGVDPNTTDASVPATNSIGSMVISNSGPFQVRGFRTGYKESDVVSNTFNFFVANPVIKPPGLSSSNQVEITLSSDTKQAELFWTIDGTEPTRTSNLYSNKFFLGQSGWLQVRGYRAGYTDSAIVSNQFSLKVAPIKISPPGLSSNNAVRITLTSGTTNPVPRIYWTIDGTDPETNGATSFLYTAPFFLTTSGTLKVRGFVDGIDPSDISSATFNLTVATTFIAVTPDKDVNINEATVVMTTITTNPPAQIRYTLDGSTPTTNSTLYTAPLTVVTNSNFRAAGFVNGFIEGGVTNRNVGIQVDTPVMFPPGGFFQDGTTVTLSVKYSNSVSQAKIYYTLNGNDPGTNDFLYTGPIPINSFTFPAGDLRQVKARAFALNTIPSEIVSGGAATNNTLGASRNVNAGIGSTVVVPIVVGLKPGDVLRTIQFRVQVWPDSASIPNLPVDSLRVLSVSTNDFVQIRTGDAAGGTATFNVFSPPREGTTVLTNEIVVSAIGAQAKFFAENFATVSLLSIALPAGAQVGNTYKIRVLEPSGTSDGQQKQVVLAPGPSRTISVTNISYVVGDSSPASWYNAGDFGESNLDNSDVNNAFYASLGLRVPYRFTDVFDAMDAYPLDEEGFAGGDGQIRFLDWQVILLRSLRRDTNNWSRAWTNGGIRLPSHAGLPISPSALVAASSIAATPARAWFRQAMVEAEGVNNLSAGSTAEIPIYLNVKPGFTVNGLQFVAVVEGDPALEQAPEFVAAPGMPAARAADGAINQVSAAWDLNTALNLRDRQLLGHIRVRIPLSAVDGTSYSVRFSNADGAAQPSARAFTQFDFESLSAALSVGFARPADATRFSDEWKTRFFGSLNNRLADLNADPDGDGIPNWKENLDGTDPTQLRLRVQQAVDTAKNTFKFQWFGLPGQKYTLECSSDLTGGQWTVIATNVLGDGSLKEFLSARDATRSQFYRIRLQD